MSFVLLMSLCTIGDSPSPSPAETRVSKPMPLRNFANQPFSKGMTLDQVIAIIMRMELGCSHMFIGDRTGALTHVFEFEVSMRWDETGRVKSIEKLEFVSPKPTHRRQ
jgi:hypothetical protein